MVYRIMLSKKELEKKLALAFFVGFLTGLLALIVSSIVINGGW